MHPKCYFQILYITQCTGLTMQLRVIRVKSFKLIYWMVKPVSIL